MPKSFEELGTLVTKLLKGATQGRIHEELARVQAEIEGRSPETFNQYVVEELLPRLETGERTRAELLRIFERAMTQETSVYVYLIGFPEPAKLVWKSSSLEQALKIERVASIFYQMKVENDLVLELDADDMPEGDDEELRIWLEGHVSYQMMRAFITGWGGVTR